MEGLNAHSVKRSVRKRRSSISNAPDVRKEVVNETLFQHRGHISNSSKSPLNKMLPSLNENDPGLKQLFLAKVQQCCTKIYNPYNEFQMTVKSKTLSEIYNFISRSPTVFDKETSKSIASLVKSNCFKTTVRPLCDTEYFSSDDDVEYNDPFWPHKQIIYDIFFKLIMSEQFVLLVPEVLNQTFIVVLIDQLGSEYAEERFAVKSIIHRMYARFINLRSFLRTEFLSFLSNYIATNSRGFGVAEILDIYSSIVSGFNIPIKLEHIMILTKILVPLHNVDNLGGFNNQLTICLKKYIQKDENLARVILTSLLKIWPRTNSHKAVLYLKEIESLLECIQYSTIKDIYPKIMSWIALCVRSNQFKISERALQLLANRVIGTNILLDKEENLRDIIVALLWNRSNHWNVGIRMLNDQIISLYQTECADLIMKISEELGLHMIDNSIAVVCESPSEKINDPKIDEFWNYIIAKIPETYKTNGTDYKRLLEAFYKRVEDIY